MINQSSMEAYCSATNPQIAMSRMSIGIIAWIISMVGGFVDPKKILKKGLKKGLKSSFKHHIKNAIIDSATNSISNYEE